MADPAKRGGGGSDRVVDADAPASSTVVGPGETAVPTEGIEEPPPAPLARGTMVGRYMVLDLIGRGGMGAIYSAYDPELDRRIALKLLSFKRRQHSRVARARERLQREAQALARVSHPNVVAVYDVGTYEESVFIAMELIEGQTLRRWMREDRPMRQILEVMLAAGRGLAGAHKAGLIHRDFKPDNVIVGTDGRVCVLDFGLARAAALVDAADEASVAADERPALDAAAGDVPSSRRLLDVSLTVAGSVMGTPGYMAPEQYQGQAVDEHTDQFCYCNTLYELLYGEHPFGTTVGEIKQHTLTGAIRTPENDRVPARLRRILLRGLAVDKAERYPSMEALLADLSRDPRAAAWRILAVAGIAVLASLAVVGFLRRGRGPALCSGADEQLASAWNAERQTSIRNAFAATRTPFAARAADTSIAALDDYARRWTDMNRSACEATRLRGQQSEELLDLRMQCLAERRQEMSVVASALASADSDTAQRSLKIVQSLSSIDDCANARLLKEPVKPPADPAQRARVQALRDRIAHARGLDDAGKFAESFGELGAVVAEAQSLLYLPLEAEARYEFGRAQSHRGDDKAAAGTLEQAVLAAEEGRHDRIAADAAVDLVRVLAQGGEQQFDLALAWSQHASAWIRRIGGDDATQSRLQHNVGILQFRRGKYDLALSSFQEALRLREKVFGPEHANTLESLGEIANTYEAQGKRAEAADIGRRVLATTEKSLGSDHPAVAAALVNLGAALGNQGKVPEALEMYQRALSIFEHALPNDHPFIATLLLNIGESYALLGRIDEGLATEERALAMQRRLHGPRHPQVAVALGAVGELEGMRGNWSKSLAAQEEALAIQEQALGPNHPDLADTLIALGRAEMKLHQSARARKHLQRALSLPVTDPQILAEARKLLAGNPNPTGAR